MTGCESYRSCPICMKRIQDKIIGHAEKLAEGIKAINLIENKTDLDLISISDIDSAVSNWSQHFDNTFGGYQRAPKFMMPVNLNFLLHYATSRKDSQLLEYVNTTLTKMALGRYFRPGRWWIFTLLGRHQMACAPL